MKISDFYSGKFRCQKKQNNKTTVGLVEPKFGADELWDVLIWRHKFETDDEKTQNILCDAISGWPIKPSQQKVNKN